MQQFRRFSHGLAKLADRHRGDGLNVTVEALRSHFAAAMHGLPEDMTEEFYLYFLDRYARSGAPEEAFLEQADYLSALVGLFSGEELDSATLNEQDWVFIRETVTSYAGELPMKLVTSIMSEALRRGAFDQA